MDAIKFKNSCPAPKEIGNQKLLSRTRLKSILWQWLQKHIIDSALKNTEFNSLTTLIAIGTNYELRWLNHSAQASVLIFNALNPFDIDLLRIEPWAFFVLVKHGMIWNLDITWK